MRDKTYHIYLNSHERKLLVHSLVEFKNQLIQQGRYTDCKNTFALCGSFHRMDRMRYLGIKHLDFLTVCTFDCCRNWDSVGFLMVLDNLACASCRRREHMPM